MTMPVQPPVAVPPPPAAPQPPQPGAPGTITIPVPDGATGAFDPRTGEPLTAPAATDPSGVWGSGVVPATPPAPTATVAPPAVPAAVPAPVAAPGTGTPIQPVLVGGQQYFTAEALEEARRQEREKLYGRLEDQGQQLQRVTAFVDEERQRREEAERQAEAAKEAERQSGLTVEQRLEEMHRNYQADLQRRDEELARRDAILEQERRLQGLEQFKAQRISAEQDLIHPSLLWTIQGTSEAEIEQSITAAKASTDAMVQDMQGQQALRPGIPPATSRMVAPTGAPTVDPSVNTPGQQTFSAQDIAQMDSATYAKNRPALMQAVSARAAAGLLYQP